MQSCKGELLGLGKVGVEELRKRLGPVPEETHDTKGKKIQGD